MLSKLRLVAIFQQTLFGATSSVTGGLTGAAGDGEHADLAPLQSGGKTVRIWDTSISRKVLKINIQYFKFLMMALNLIRHITLCVNSKRPRLHVIRCLCETCSQLRIFISVNANSPDANHFKYRTYCVTVLGINKHGHVSIMSVSSSAI